MYTMKKELLVEDKAMLELIFFLYVDKHRTMRERKGILLVEVGFNSNQASEY